MKDRLISEISNQFTFLSVLGKGAFGTVTECVNLSSKKKVAIKVIKKYKLTEKQLLASIQESELLGRLSHPNIVKFIQLHHTQSFLLLEMELLTGGTLGQVLSKFKFTEEQAASTMEQVFSGVCYLHRIRVLHRDLKPENIIFEDDSHKVAKITDFGLSTKYTLEERLDQRSGTVGYMAPEQLLLKQYSEPVDIWSCGIILYQLITNIHPLIKNRKENHEYIDILKNISWSFPDSFPELAKDLFLRCTKINPLERYTASLALQHPWITRKKTKIPLTHMEEYRNYHDKLKLKKILIAGMNLAGLMPRFSLGDKYLRKMEDPTIDLKEKNGEKAKKAGSLSNFEIKASDSFTSGFRKRELYGNQLCVPGKMSSMSNSPTGGKHRRNLSSAISKSPSPRNSISLPKSANKTNRNKYSINFLK